MEKYSNRQKQIEGLRGVGLLFVVISHYISVFQKDYCGGLFHDYLFIEYWGEIGVAIFLLISGYFIVPKKRSTVFEYVKKRIIKIWPLYFVSITITFFITRIIYLPNRTVSFIDYLLNIPFINGFIAIPYVDHSHWYLTILLSSILIFSLIKSLSPNQRHFCYWVWILVVIALYYYNSANTVLHLLRSGLYVLLGRDFAIIIILGATIADIKNERIDRRCLITIALIIIAKFLTATHSRFFEIPFITALFLLTLQNKIPFFETKSMLFLGKISFATYLIHQNIGYIMLLQIVHLVGHFSVWMSILMVPIALVIGLVLHLIENLIAALLEKFHLA